MTTANQSTAVEATKERNISDSVLLKIQAFKNAGQIRIPDDYSPENALKAAFLILSETKNADGRPALEHCTNTSVANALLKMVVWGLSPMKKQCSFIMRGSQLFCDPDYTGNIMLAKRYGNLKSIKANAICKGDTFEFSVDPKTGRKSIVKHEQTLQTIGSKEIMGAYAVYELNDGTIDTEIMNMDQIMQAWEQGPMKGKSPAHRNFPDQMACKTVINRSTKLLIRSSDDSILYDSDEEEKRDIVAEDVNYEVVNNANKTEIDFKEDSKVEEPVKSKQEEPKEQTAENKQNCGF